MRYRKEILTAGKATFTLLAIVWICVLIALLTSCSNDNNYCGTVSGKSKQLMGGEYGYMEYYLHITGGYYGYEKVTSKEWLKYNVGDQYCK